MKKFLSIPLVVIFITFVFPVQAQPTFDLREIGRVVSDSTSPYFHPKLMARYFADNHTLSLEEYRYLYYGSMFQADYTPFKDPDSATGDLEREFYKNLSRKKYKKAIEWGEQAFRADPLDLRLIKHMADLLNKVGRTVEAGVWENRFNRFVEVIASSGDGKSLETGYVTATVRDEFIFLQHYLRLHALPMLSYRDPLNQYGKKTMYIGVSDLNSNGAEGVFFNIEFMSYLNR
jgi:hypothetical protein